ncbi:hypothetical protein TL16_g04954 [Triparma laevis f. inornata]|uniref:Uncharacterized protein n=1 Tax=Triparma laevis f. inornata TaxID=1714386 RepID=A0A9W7AEM3_9STRA|nr:hypothetical protein TL16_g04954 [Triparma laevis f. inornata]
MVLRHLPTVNPEIGFLQSAHGSPLSLDSTVHSIHVAECPHGLSFALATLSRQATHKFPSSFSSSSSSSSLPLIGTAGTVGTGAEIFFFSGATHIFLCHFQCDL